jgi:hypothetical protein
MEFVCFVWISEQTENFAVQSIKRLFFITELDSVYSAVRTGPYISQIFFVFERLKYVCCKLEGKHWDSI